MRTCGTLKNTNETSREENGEEDIFAPSRARSSLSRTHHSREFSSGQYRRQNRLNSPVPVARTAAAPAQTAVIFPPRVPEYLVTRDFLKLEGGLLDIRLLEVNFQLRVGLEKSKIIIKCKVNFRVQFNGLNETERRVFLNELSLLRCGL